MGGLHKGDLRSLCELGKFADAQPFSILSFACARAHFTYAHTMQRGQPDGPAVSCVVRAPLLAPPPTLLMNTMQRISKPLHRASPRARHAVCCAAVAVARAVMQRTSGLLHHALLAPLHCSRPCPFSCAFARATAAATVASRAIARAAAAATVALHAARTIDRAIDRAIDRGCSGSRDRLHPASPRRCSPTAPFPTLRPCSCTRGECPPNGPLMLAANHARTALTRPHTMQRHPVNRHHRACTPSRAWPHDFTRVSPPSHTTRATSSPCHSPLVPSHMPAACRRRRYAAVASPPSHRRRRTAAVASPPSRRRR